jgi:hypothetical protein
MGRRRMLWPMVAYVDERGYKWGNKRGLTACIAVLSKNPILHRVHFGCTGVSRKCCSSALVAVYVLSQIRQEMAAGEGDARG